MPNLPADKLLLHQATQFLEDAISFMANEGDLITFAQDHETREMAAIVDPPVPAKLAPGDRNEYRNEQERRNAEHVIEKNNAKRLQLWITASNKLFHTIKVCAKNAPLFQRELITACDLSSDSVPSAVRQPSGTFDGPLAYRMLLKYIFPEERTEADKKYYRIAEDIQRNNPLPAGCAVGEYNKRAMAFLHKIAPYQAAKHSPSDISEYLINMMPKDYRAEGRRIKKELQSEELWLDHMEVIKRCAELVEEEQKTNVKLPALAAMPEGVLQSQYASLAETTAIAMVAGGSGPLIGAAGVEGDGTGKRWCSGCPHPRNFCLCDPRFTGKPMLAIYCHREKWQLVCRTREENAKKEGMPKPLDMQKPGAEELKAFKEKQAEKKKKWQASRETTTCSKVST